MGALAFMHTRWPEEGGNFHDRALEACRGAMSDRSSVAAARHAFIDASTEAGLVVVRDFEHLQAMAGASGSMDHSPDAVRAAN